MLIQSHCAKPTLGYVNGMPSKTCSLPDDTTLLWHHTRHLPAYELVCNWLLAVRIELVRICHLPSPAGGTIVVAHSGAHGLYLRLLSIECIAVRILLAAKLAISLNSIDLEYRVVLTIYVGIYTETKHVLVIVG